MLSICPISIVERYSKVEKTIPAGRKCMLKIRFLARWSCFFETLFGPGTDDTVSSIDIFIRFLQTSSVLPPPLPLLPQLAIGKDPLLDVKLLAEVLLSCNYSSSSYRVKGLGGGRCSSLILRLESGSFEAFNTAEKAPLSRYSKELAEVAGRTKVELWKRK